MKTPDATGGDASSAVPVPSTGSGSSAAAPEEPGDTSETPTAPRGAEPPPELTELAPEEAELAPEEAEPVEASGTIAAPERQPVVRVRGSRRARLLPAPGTTAEPAPADESERGRGSRPAASGPNDERMLRDVPPHY